MTIRQNHWTLGTFCESYCRVVTQHHTLEDQGVFPHIQRSDPSLAPVIERLEEEHETIADLLERVDQALVGLVSSQGGIEGVDRAVAILNDALLSHFSYEERELVEPLARFGFDRVDRRPVRTTPYALRTCCKPVRSSSSRTC